MKKGTISEFLDTAEMKKQLDVALDYIKQFNAAILNAQKINMAPDPSGISAAQAAAQAASASAQTLANAATNLSKIQPQVAQAIQQTTAAINAQQVSLNETLKTQALYQQRLKEISAQLKAVEADYKAGKISQDQFAQGTANLLREQASLKATTQALSQVIKLQVKDEEAAAGSVEQLRAKLLLLQKSFDNLSETERKSPLGKQLQETLISTNKTVSDLEQTTGRFQRNVGNYKSAGDGFVSSVKNGFGEVVSTLQGFVLQAGAVFGAAEILKQSIEAIIEKEQNIARLKATLDNLGKADAFDRLEASAKKLSNQFKYLQDDDLFPVFEKLIDYGKLTEKQLTELTPVIINFAAKQRIGLGEATDVITKALEGNGKALKSYGINIKDAKTEAERLEIVMTSLKEKVDGAGEAFGETTAGKIAESKRQFTELKEEIGDGLLPVLNGLLAGLKYVGIGLEDVASRGKNLLIKFFNPTLAALREVQQYQETLKNNANEFAQGLSPELSKLDTSELTTRQIAEQANIDRLDKILKSRNKIINDDDKQYAAQARANSQAVLEQIKVEIDNRNKLTLGAGGGEGGKGDADNTKLKTIRQKFFADELKDYVEQTKKLSENDALQLNSRIAFRKAGMAVEKDLLQQEYDAAVQVEKDKLDDVLANDKSSKNARINAENEYQARVADLATAYNYKQLKAAKQLQSDLIVITATAAKARKDEEAAIDKDFKEQQAAAEKTQVEKITALYNDQIYNQQAARDYELTQLEKDHNAKLISDEDYGKRRAEIENKYAIIILEREAQLAQDLINLHKSQGKDVAKEEAELAAIRLKIAQGLTNGLKAENDNQYANLEKGIEKAKSYFDQLSKLVTGLTGAAFDKQKNDLQEQIDLVEKKAKADVDAENASADAAQVKADKIAVINARKQAQQTELETRQRKIDQERARYEKAANIANIIITTALAVVKALSQGGIPLAVVTAAFGAAELAVAIATPIPKFKKGRKGGPATLGIVGDGGVPEVIASPDHKQAFITPDKDTLVNIPQDWNVYSDVEKYQKAIRANSFKGLPAMPAAVQPLSKEDYAAITRAEFATMIKAIQNKKEVSFYWHNGELRKAIKNAGSIDKYINDNLFA